MTGSSRAEGAACDSARAVLHRLLDGDRVDPAPEAAYRAHLVACRDCREAEADLRLIQTELRTLPVAGLPETALERVWRRTTRATDARAPRLRPRLIDWRPIAAAAALAVVLLGVWTIREPEPRDNEALVAAAEARLVLTLTARTLSNSRETMVRDVLAERISPALKLVPMPRRAEDGTP